MIALFTALVAYCLASFVQWRYLYRPSVGLRVVFLLLFLLALCAHAVCLYHWIDVRGQQNLSAVNAFSLLCFAINLILLLLQWRSYMAMLCCVSFPLAMLSLILVPVFPGHVWMQTASHWIILSHILLGLLVAALLSVASLMALWVICLDQRIRSHRLSRVDERLPSLTRMQKHLIQMLAVAFVALSVILFQSGWLYPWAWQSLGPNQIKAILVSFVWLILAASLAAHYTVGWRGRRIIVTTLVSALLLGVVLMTR